MLRVTKIHPYKKNDDETKLPFFTSKIKAGFPSPADSYLQKKLDLNELLIDDAESTYFVEVSGESMKDAGILDGDILIVNKSKSPKNDDIIIAVVNGDLTVKRYVKKNNGETYLMAENPDYPPIELGGEMETSCWGVVTASVHRF